MPACHSLTPRRNPFTIKALCFISSTSRSCLRGIVVSTPSRSGVFGSATDPKMLEFSESISHDHRLYQHDINGSIAHAQMLAKSDLISTEDCQQIEQALQAIRQEIEQGEFVFLAAHEDIHMAIESRLVELLGDVGRKLHTARSRNDQVSTDMRLWIRDAIQTIDSQLACLQIAFLKQAEQGADLILPAYTHLRRAQPVLGAHYMLAYCEKFNRDRERLENVNQRNNVLPLGTGAVAGTSLPIDREMVRQQLGFDSVAANSLDASSDRDFVLDFSYALSMIGVHLSGWAEEWILWSTVEFNFMQLPESFCTCSSMMPQKMNPDALELIRGKSARLTGYLNSLLTLIKGLPLAYNRDLQEDKVPTFDAFDTIFSCLEIAVPLIEQSHWNREAIQQNIEQGYLDATTLMEYLILKGVPQRSAHHAVGTIVRAAMDHGVSLRDLPLKEMQDICKQVDEGVYEILGTENSIAAFQSAGSTGITQVTDQIALWKKRLGVL